MPVAGRHLLAEAVALPSASSRALISLSSALVTIEPRGRLLSPGSLTLPLPATASFASRKRNLSTTSLGRRSVSPGLSTRTLRSIWAMITSMCLSLMGTPWAR